MYRDPAAHPRVSPAELAHIRSDPAGADRRHRRGSSLLRHRQTWAFIVGKSLTDPVWLFYLFWLPKFLDASCGVKLAGLAAPLVAIYVVADVGSVGGGWFSSALISRGWTVNRGRKTAMLIAALSSCRRCSRPLRQSMWVAVAIVSVAAAAHQWWSCNLFTTGERHVPAARGRVGGRDRRVRGRDGAMGFQRLTGYILEATGSNYRIIFVICAIVYVGALVLFHLLPMAPRAIGHSPARTVGGPSRARLDTGRVDRSRARSTVA